MTTPNSQADKLSQGPNRRKRSSASEAREAKASDNWSSKDRGDSRNRALNATTINDIETWFSLHPAKERFSRIVVHKSDR
jgi:hypothetical protein